MQLSLALVPQAFKSAFTDYIISTAIQCDFADLSTPEGEKTSFLRNTLTDSTPYVTAGSVVYRICNDTGYGLADNPTHHRRAILCSGDGMWSDDSVKNCIRKCAIVFMK